jgi:hypothetical protein
MAKKKINRQLMKSSIKGNFISLIFLDDIKLYEVGIFIKNQGSAINRFSSLKDAKKYYTEQKRMMRQYSK